VMILLSALRRKDTYGEEPWGEDQVTDLDVGFVTAFWRDSKKKVRRKGSGNKPGDGPGGGAG